MKYFLSRIDRSVADNLRDIERSFGQDSGIVTDFIVFITRQLKANIFGYAKFTLSEFCKETGRNKQDLCSVHPYFKNNPKEKPPEYFDHKYESCFDYALFNMLQKNIIFSKAYNWNANSKSIVLEKFSILKDIKITIDTKKKGVKVYDVRLSDDMLQGFLQRYYTLETNGYKFVGKGRGGDGRKALFIFLYKTRHILVTQHVFKTKFPIDYLCSVAGIVGEKSFHRKQSLERVITHIQEKGNMPFEYLFLQGDPTKKYQEDYWVEFNFLKEAEDPTLIEKTGDNYFFITLLEGLKHLFNARWANKKKDGEKDLFQRFLSNNSFALVEKAEILVKSYHSAYGVNLDRNIAVDMVEKGIFTNGLEDDENGAEVLLED